jgi:hypothetical protein
MDVLIVLSVMLLAALAVYCMIRRKKKGKMITCGGDCRNCPYAPYEKGL